MKHHALIVEDDPDIAESVADTLESLGHQHDWARSQEEARDRIAKGGFTYVLLDLQIPVRHDRGLPCVEFGEHLAREIHQSPTTADVPVIAMTAYGSEGFAIAGRLFEHGVRDCISKPFPRNGRTLAVVIEDVLEKHRRFRTPAAGIDDQPLAPFDGAVLAYYPDHIDLGGVTICERTQRGCAWQILQALGQKDERGHRVHLQSTGLARQINPKPIQNTLFRAISTLRKRIETAMKRCGKDCGREDVIGHDEGGYHLTDKIVVEVYDEDGTPIGHSDGNGQKAANGTGAKPKLNLNDKQRWALARLAENGTLTRREVEKQFDISDRTAKRLLGELTEADLIEFDRTTHPGFYRLK